ncbi:MAG: type II secretion system F family protein [Fervidicoccaceae archaeon]
MRITMNRNKERSAFEIGLFNIAMALALSALTFILSWQLFERFLSSLFSANPFARERTYIVLTSLNLAFIIGSIPLAFRVRKIVREEGNSMRGIVLFLDMVSVGTKTGSNVLDSMRRAVRFVPSEGLKNKLKNAISEVEMGGSFENAVKRSSSGLPKLVSESIKALIPSSQAGPRAGDVLLLARDFVRKLMLFADVRRTSLALYFYISLLSLAIFEGGGVFLIYLISSIVSSSLPSASFLNLNIIQTWTFLFLTGLELSIFSSLFVAKVVRGKIKLSADYAEFFLLVNYITMGLIPLFL